MQDFSDEIGDQATIEPAPKNKGLDVSGGTRYAAILAAALGLWSSSPYQAVSLRRIAERAGVGLALIDHHFGTKECLLQAVLVPLGKLVREALVPLQPLQPPQPVDRDTALDRSVVLLTQVVDHLAASPQGDGLMRLWLLHRHERLPEVHVPVSHAVAPLFHQLHDWMQPHLTIAGPLKAQPVLAQALAAAIETELFFSTPEMFGLPVDDGPCERQAEVVRPVLCLLFGDRHAA